MNTMKKAKKAILLALCAVLLVGASVAGTLAYLKDNDAVTNTFTVGKVEITLDETKVNEYGVPVPSATPVAENGYRLIPGATYTKNPTVHVTAESEPCWLFVKVRNGISAYEAATGTGGYQNITAQVTANGWTKLDGEDDVYYRDHSTKDAVDYSVFGQFKIADDANTKEGWSNIGAGNEVVVTAYAIQKAGFTTAALAWAEVNK